MTLMSQDVWKKVACGGILEPCFGSPLVGAVGTPLNALGTARVSLLINFSSACSKSFQVGVVVVSGLTADVILGLDFLVANNCTIDAGQSKLNFPHENLSVTLGARGGRQMSSSEIPVSLGVSVSVPAYSEMEVMAKVPSELSSGTWIFEGKQQAPKEKRDLIWTTVNDTCQNLNPQEREEYCISRGCWLGWPTQKERYIYLKTCL